MVPEVARDVVPERPHRSLPRPLRPDRSWVAPAAILVAVVANAAWVVTQRRGQPLNIDEAGYAGIAFTDLHGLQSGGVTGWWHQVVAQPVQAPLAPALASLLAWATGPRVLDVFAVSLLAYGALLASTAGLTRGWSRVGRGTALFFVAASPVLLEYSRSFVFAELAAACLAAAMYFGLRSRCFTRTAPALAWGGCLGLMALSRTMTVAFLPGLVLAAVVPVLARRSFRGLLRVLAGLAAGAAVAATWYVHNFGGVYAYLTSYGYGAHASAYGASRSPLSPHDWYVFLQGEANSYFFAGVAAFLLAGWLATAWTVARRCRRLRPASGGIGPVLRWARIRVAAGPAVLSCSIVAVAGMVVLMSSRNQGSAFVAPLVVPLVVVASWGIAVVTGHVVARRRRVMGALLGLAAAAVLVLTSVSAALTFLPLPVQVAASVPLPLPGSPSFVVWNSASTLRGYEDAGDIPASAEPDPGSRATGRAWLAVSAYVDDTVRRASNAEQRPPLVVLTFNDRMVNINTVALDSLVRYGSVLSCFLVQPLPGGTQVAGYLQEAERVRSYVTVVATVTGAVDEFQPQVPAGVGPAYARSLGFTPFARRRLPDDQWLELWGPAGLRVPIPAPGGPTGSMPGA